MRHLLITLGLLSFVAILPGCQNEEVVDEGTPVPSLAPPVYQISPQRAPTPVRSAQVPAISRIPQTANASRLPPAVSSGSSIPREWIPQAPLRPWESIVIHHSATDRGSAASFDAAHRARGWDCLGYDFVIGNGSLSRNGEIETGPRWIKQMVGAHAGVKFYNETGIGICLVGDFQVVHPSAMQMKAAAQLVGFLMRTYHIPPNKVISHGQAKDGQTLCPGKYLDMATLRRTAAQYAGVDEWLSPMYEAREHDALAFGGELMKDAE